MKRSIINIFDNKIIDILDPKYKHTTKEEKRGGGFIGNKTYYRDKEKLRKERNKNNISILRSYKLKTSKEIS